MSFKNYFFLKICLFFFSLYFLYASEPSFLIKTGEKPDFLVLTIPKSGTYLLDKLLKMILVEHQKRTGKRKKYLLQHCVDLQLKNYSKYKKIIMIRDMRDVCISLTLSLRGYLNNFGDNNFVLQYPQQYPAPLIEYYRWSLLSVDVQLLGIIEGNLPPPLNHCKVQPKAALRWMQTPYTYVCRFENLIGEKGGGTRERQKREIKNIGNFINISLSNETIDYIANNLHGNKVFESPTFIRGKIGYWKEYFNEYHKAIFKQKLGEYLILWGYEKNSNW